MKRREVIPFAKGQMLDLELTLPGSKSITNRAFLCAALSSGKSRIYGALESDDTKVMRTALSAIGVKIRDVNGAVEIEGGNFNSDTVTFDLNNAGTATRFLTAVMCARVGKTVITGNKHMLKRPIGDLIDGLRQIGADIAYMEKEGYLPIKIAGKRLNGGEIIMNGAKSSQYFSALLMLAPLLQDSLTIKVDGSLTSKPYMDITLSVLKAFGINAVNQNYHEFSVDPQCYTATDYTVEGDASSASYFTALRHLHGGNLTFKNLNKKSVQGDSGFVDVLDEIEKNNLHGRASEIDMNSMPDAAMTLATMAPFFDGGTRITGLGNLRIKETDRLAALENELKKVGVNVSTTRDSITVEGGDLRGFEIETYDDHRMAMTFAIFGTKVPGIVIQNPDCTGKSYPMFWQNFETAYLSHVSLGSRHLVLTGMRAVGKTHYAKKIAELLGRKLVDIDHEIENEADKTISEIVEKDGWDVFREIEQKMCSKIASSIEPLVISTGGGVVLRPDNMKVFKQSSVIVFIFADPLVLLERRKKSYSRPALHSDCDVIEEIEKVWSERRDLYLKYADVVWDDTSGNVIGGQLRRIFA